MRYARAIVLVLLSSLLATSVALADDWPRFRGPKGDGQSAETGLLTAWPEGGPKQLWSIDGLGIGWSGVAVVGRRIYTTSMETGQGFLHCIGTDGKRLWKVGYGKEWDGTAKHVYPGAHSTPTVDGDRVYLISGYGVVHCADAATGKKLWSVDTVAAYGGRNIRWGIAESPLVDADGVYASPGGPEAAVVKLDKKTGKLLWKCATDQKSAYCSPALFTVGGRAIVVQMLEDGMVGIDARTGKLLWEEQMNNRSNVHANTPVRAGSRLVTAIAVSGLVSVTLGKDGGTITSEWDAALMDASYGGFVMIGDHLYGTSSVRPKARLLCVDAKTGKQVAESRAVGQASVIAAEGMLYCYGYQGTVALITASPKGLELRGQFTVTQGSGEHWSHPSIADKVLYIRRGSHLMAYDIARK